MDIKRGLAPMVYKFLDKKSSSGSGVNNEITQNKKLVEELQKTDYQKI